MKITVTQDTFPLAELFTISRGSRTVAKVLTIALERNGITGYAESVPYERYDETFESVTAQIMGMPEDFTRANLYNLLPAGAARNALDCALWDLAAKTTGKRAWQLAGLKPPRPERTAYTLSLAEPKEMRAQAEKNSARPILKIKLGTADDIPRLEAVRKGAPQSDIIIDANEGWSADLYLELAPHLLRLGVKLVEQPLPASEDEALIGMTRLIPICADESCHDRMSLTALAGKYDVINIKLDKTGGLTEALELKKSAQSLGYGIMVGCMVGSSLAMAPATLVAQEAQITDLDGPLLLAKDRSVKLDYINYSVHPPKAALWG